MSETPYTDRAPQTDASIAAQNAWEAVQQASRRIPERLEQFRAVPSAVSQQAITEAVCDYFERERLCVEAINAWGKLGNRTAQDQAAHAEMATTFNAFKTEHHETLTDMLKLFK